MTDAVRKRFGETAQLVAEQQDRRAAETRERLRRLLTLTGEERALDVGTGAGALAIALAPLVREVVGVDIVPELLAEGRKRAPANVELVEADATALPFERGSFDLVCTARTLHHVPRPELVLAEMNRVLRPGGTMLVVDQLAPVDPLAAIELNRFERARDPSTTRILADVDLRGLFDANSLVLRHAEIVREERDLDRYLDLAGCHGDERERAALAPMTGAPITAGKHARSGVSAFRRKRFDARVESEASCRVLPSRLRQGRHERVELCRHQWTRSSDSPRRDSRASQPARLVRKGCARHPLGHGKTVENVLLLVAFDLRDRADDGAVRR